MVPEEAEEARLWCREAEAVIITAGAGMGVDSGLPDFRGKDGFWKAYPAYRHLGFNFMEMASPSRFMDAPELGWGFYGHRLNLYETTKPHGGFERLRVYGASRLKGAFVFTSNVDGHFQRAGFPEACVVECHGSIRHLQCFDGCTDSIWESGGMSLVIDSETMRAQAPLPSCPHCGGLARPNILMFGDWGWIGERTWAQDARLQAWLRQLDDCRVVVLEIGAGTTVATVRRFSETVVKQTNGKLIRVNPREPEIDGPGIGLRMRASEAIEWLLEAP